MITGENALFPAFADRSSVTAGRRRHDGTVTGDRKTAGIRDQPGSDRRQQSQVIMNIFKDLKKTLRAVGIRFTQQFSARTAD